MCPPTFDLRLGNTVFVQNNGTENQNHTNFNGKVNPKYQAKRSYQNFNDYCQIKKSLRYMDD